MKGMMNFLEKAGLVQRDEPLAPTSAAEVKTSPEIEPAVARQAASTVVASSALPVTTELDLDSIYATAGVSPALYPAERLLRLVDGLGAMDPATRLMAIQAMDAADESWTIADPLQNAADKIQALAAYQDTVRLKLQQLESETQNQLDLSRTRQEQVVGEIRKQIAELEALVARELARGEQVTAEHQSNLEQARQQTAGLLQAANLESQRLRSLSSQFGSYNTDQQKA